MPRLSQLGTPSDRGESFPEAILEIPGGGSLRKRSRDESREKGAASSAEERDGVTGDSIVASARRAASRHMHKKRSRSIDRKFTSLQSGLWGSDADGGGPTPSSAPLHLFTSSTDIGALVLRP